MLDEKEKSDAECSRKVVGGRKVAGAIDSMVIVKELSLGYARILHVGMMLPELLYGSETIVSNRKNRSKVQSAQVNNLRSLFGGKRTEKI